MTNRLVTFKAGRFIPEENYAKEIRFDFAPYSNYDSKEHPELERYYLGADGLPVTGWQTINGNRYFSKMMETWSCTDFSITITSTMMELLLEIDD